MECYEVLIVDFSLKGEKEGEDVLKKVGKYCQMNVVKICGLQLEPCPPPHALSPFSV